MITVKKPWGREIWIAYTKKYIGKIIFIKKGYRLSKQYHKVKDETLYCDKGKFLLELGRKKIIIKPGTSIRVKPGVVHRMTAKYSDVRIIETSTPHPKDRVRIEDDYGRKTG